MPCVYRHIRLDKNEPFYIGIGKTEKRAYETIKRNKYWSNIVNNSKYEIEILFNDITWEMAKDKEKEFIKLYGRCDINNGILCNLTDGGDGTINRKHTQETKSKMSKSRVGILKSEEWKSKIAESHKGMVITESTRQKLIDSHKGKTMPQEQKDKIRLSLKNRYFSPEHREKISIALKNRKKINK